MEGQVSSRIGCGVKDWRIGGCLVGDGGLQEFGSREISAAWGRMEGHVVSAPLQLWPPSSARWDGTEGTMGARDHVDAIRENQYIGFNSHECPNCPRWQGHKVLIRGYCIELQSRHRGAARYADPSAR